MPNSTLNSFPLISIITVNYNQAKTTMEMIESLSNITYPNIEIIVVDNASTKEDPQIIKETYPRIILIESVLNYGFAGGNNLGIMRARGEYILLLNNDTIVDPNFLEPLVKKFQDNPKIGAISPKIRYFYKKDTFQYAGYTEINKWTIRNKTIGENEIDTGQYDEDRETAYTHGAAMMVPMEVIKKVGMMSYEFFLYYEEADWCLRIRKYGYKIMYVHNSLVYHKGSVTTGKNSALKVHYLTRNRLVFMRRNIHGIEFVFALLYQIVVAIGKNSIIFILKGKWKLAGAYWSGILWNVKNVFNKEIHDNPMI
ncbi:MAG: glycosyltransferase family 2 protein [Bacteroidetes bacterium]|nr:MAG: glycosyltransferase family 2 protein [Bacteroidota bacterium]